MPFMQHLTDALAWLGRQGTRAVALSIFVGLAVPQFAAVFKPFIGATIFAMLTLAFLRVNPAELRGLFTRPALIVIATVWTMAILPLIMGSAHLLLGTDRIAPGVLTALILQGAAPPVTLAPVLAALMGLDAAVALALLVLATAATPITTPLIASYFLGVSLPVSPAILGLKLFLFLAGAAGGGMVLRWLLGQARLDRGREHIDGANVLLMFIFAIALMDGVAARAIADPLLVFSILAICFAVNLAQILLTTIVFVTIGWRRAFGLGVATGSRNMGLAVATVGAGMTDVTWLYFSLAQFPIYLLPQILKPLARLLPHKADPNASRDALLAARQHDSDTSG